MAKLVGLVVALAVFSVWMSVDHLFNVLVAQENAKVQPNALADDLSRESATLTQWLRWAHAA